MSVFLWVSAAGAWLSIAFVGWCVGQKMGADGPLAAPLVIWVVALPILGFLGLLVGFLLAGEHIERHAKRWFLS